MAGFILLAVVVCAYLVIMPLIAFNKARIANDAIAQLRAEIERLKLKTVSSENLPDSAPKKRKAPTKIAAKSNSEAVKASAPWTPPEASESTAENKTHAPSPPKPPRPSAPSFFDRAFANFKENWIIWLAAVSLALGGLFIVQYGLERGFLGPVARVICALAFGAMLLAGAEYLRRKPNIGMQGWFTVPVALAAGGIASLFGGVVSAHVLYELTTATVGFASMVAVSFIALTSGLIFGPVLAVVGILGAYISPMLVTGGETSPILYLYFLTVLVAALGLERHQKWIWLSAIAVGFTLFWGFALNASLPNEPFLPLYISAIILMATTIPAFGFFPKWHSNEMLGPVVATNVSEHYPTLLAVITAIASTAILCMIVISDSVLFQAALLILLLMSAWAVFYLTQTQNLDQMAVIFSAGIFALLITNFNRYPPNPGTSFNFEATILIGLSILMLFAAFWRSSRSCRPLYWIILGAITPLTSYAYLYTTWHIFDGVLSTREWSLFAVLLTAAMIAAAMMMLRSGLRLAAWLPTYFLSRLWVRQLL